MSDFSITDIFKHIDHTLLAQTATEDQVVCLCQEAIEVGAASVCIPLCYVEKAKEICGDNMKVCTVIGFPNGYNSTACKIAEAKEAIQNGADEIDMVINIGMFKQGNYCYVLGEMEHIKDVCENKCLKVIIETAFLTDEEKIVLCHMVSTVGVTYIKTSTGFAKSGANLKDIELFKQHLGAGIKIKAAGGIRSAEIAKQFIDAGCDRIGSSAIISDYLKKLKNN